MKTMNEFETVIVMTVLILSLCAATIDVFHAPEIRVVIPGKAYSGQGVTNLAELVKQSSSERASPPMALNTPQAHSVR